MKSFWKLFIFALIVSSCSVGSDKQADHRTRPTVKEANLLLRGFRAISRYIASVSHFEDQTLTEQITEIEAGLDVIQGYKFEMSLRDFSPWFGDIAVDKEDIPDIKEEVVAEQEESSSAYAYKPEQLTFQSDATYVAPKRDYEFEAKNLKPQAMQLSRWLHPQIQNIVLKMHSLQLLLLKTSSSSSLEPYSGQGEKLLKIAARYHNVVSRLNQLYAEVAARSGKKGSYSWSQLDRLGLILDKRFAVAIFREMPVPARHLTESYAEIEDFAQLKSELSKVKTYASTIISQLGTQQVAEFQDYASSTIYDRGLSDMASHLQSELSTNVRNYYKTDLVQFFVGMEERYFMEYTTLNDPKTRIEYARLLQFLAVRENLVNTWAINRLRDQGQRHQLPNLTSCADNSLTLKMNGNPTNSIYSQDLWRSDKYYNIMPKVFSKVIEAVGDYSLTDASKKLKLFNSEVGSIYDYIAVQMLVNSQSPKKIRDALYIDLQLFDDDPLDMQAEEFLSQLEVEDFASEVYSLEQNAWLANAEIFLNSALYIYDNMASDKAAYRIANEFFKIRYRAALSGIYKRTVDFEGISKTDASKGERFISKNILALRKLWVDAVAGKIKSVLNTHFSAANQIALKRDEKFDSIVETLKKGESIRAASVNNSIEEGFYQTSAKVHPMAVDNYELFLELFTKELRNYSHYQNPQYYGFYETIKKKDSFASSVRSFLNDIKTDFDAQVSGKEDELSPSQKNQYLQSAIKKHVYRYFAKYPYSESSLQSFYSTAFSSAKGKEAEGAPLWMIANNDSEQYATFYIPTSIYLGGEESTDNLLDPSANAFESEDFSSQTDSVTQKSIYNLGEFVAYDPNAKGVDYFIRPSKNVIFYEMFKILGFTESQLRSKSHNRYLSFFTAPSVQNQLTSKQVSAAYTAQPLLKQKMDLSRTVRKRVYYNSGTPYGMGMTSRIETVTERTKVTALELMAIRAFNKDTGAINYAEVKKIIQEALDKANASLMYVSNKGVKKSRIQMYCAIDPNNYHKSNDFKELYDHTETMRQSIIYGEQENEEKSKRLRKLDRGVFKRVHTGQYVIKNIVEPVVGVLFLIIMVAATAGFFGLALPAVIGTAIAVVNSHIITALLFASISMYNLNHTLIEMPERLKAREQVVAADLVFNNELYLNERMAFDSYEKIEEAAKQNKTEMMMTIPAAALDFFFVGAIMKQTKLVGGWLAAKNMKKVLDVATKKGGVGLARKVASWQSYHKKYGKVLGAIKKVKAEIRSVKYKSVRYQPYSRNQLEMARERAMYVKIKRMAQSKFPAGKVAVNPDGLSPELLVFKKYLTELDQSASHLWMRYSKQGAFSKGSNINKLVQKLDDVFEKLFVKSGVNFDDVLEIMTKEGAALQIPASVIWDMARGIETTLRTGAKAEALAVITGNLKEMQKIASGMKIDKTFAAALNDFEFLEKLMKFKEGNLKFMQSIGKTEMPTSFLKKLPGQNFGNMDASADFNLVFSKWVAESHEYMQIVEQLTMNFNRGVAASSVMKAKALLGVEESISFELRDSIKRAKQIQQFIRPIEDIVQDDLSTLARTK